ncbi:unnamed protein product [Macrosiphum euphorbiae]|uniref:RNA-directed DNA polymerase n=1 Tax=Macrosiphum euphorbiae TaxID=13131 RepID=A0AAV0Y776_9HEMI|nr:unnamed protein product [Macrosiphum euphorbiae]
MVRRKSNTAYNFRSGINSIQPDENRGAVHMHDHDVAVNGDGAHEAALTPAIVTPPASGEGSNQNATPDLNAMFQLLMEQNRMLMQQLSVSNSKTNNEQSNSFYVMPDLNKSVKSFTGRESGSEAKDWLKTFIGMAEINKWSDALKIESIRANLNGPAQQWFKSRRFSSWENFEQQFTRTFIGIPNRTELWHALVARTQSKNEATIDYFYDKVRLCSELCLSFEETKTQLLEGFYSQSMVTYLLSKHHTETDGMFDDILTYERLYKMRTTLYGSNKQTSSSNSNLFIKASAQKNEKNNSSLEPKQTLIKRCFNCYSTAHTIINCPEPKRKPGSCFKCGSTEHQQRDCKMKINKTSRGTSEDSTMIIEIDEASNPPFMLGIDVMCETTRWTTDALIDTGSPISIIKENAVPKDVIVIPASSKLSGINKSPLKVLGVINTKVSVNNLPVDLNIIFYVVDNNTMNYNCLLGRNFVNNNLIKLTFDKNLFIEKNDSYNEFIVDDIMLIDTGVSNSLQLDINSDLCADMQEQVKVIFDKHYTNAVRPIEKKFQYAIREKLENSDIPYYELRDGLVYRTDEKKLLFYVPNELIDNVIRTCHDNVGHVGIDKTLSLINNSYWFPKMRDKIKYYISKCLK